MTNFTKFSTQVAANVEHMKGFTLYKADVPAETFWHLYLNSFPEGTNEVYRERRQYDCSCCRHFIRDMGAVVALDGFKVMTIWDGVVGYPFDVVASTLREVVLGAVIENTFYSEQPVIGTQQNHELMPNGTLKQWNHFYCKLPVSQFNATIPTRMGRDKATVLGVQRSFREISADAVALVQELIASKQIYRGEQHKSAIDAFATARAAYHALGSSRERELFVWGKVAAPGLAIRSTVIGTLLQDLSEGKPLDVAVRSYEAKVAPTNYKRSTAPISKGMVQKATDKIRELGLEDSLTRRHATAADVNVNDVLFVSRSAKPLMQGLSALEVDLLSEVKPKQKRTTGQQEIDVDTFMSTILPQAHKLEVLMEQKHVPNLMSLVAPATPNKTMFSWDNEFSWAYNGDVTDSIAERVVKAGGSVDGVCRVSLSWYNIDDLDLHVSAPDGTRTYYGKRNPVGPYGHLDVDMNVSTPYSRKPVENIIWTRHIQDGVHRVFVKQYTKRRNTDAGFAIQVAYAGFTETWHYTTALGQGQKVPVATIKTANNRVVAVIPHASMHNKHLGQNVWGIKTEDFVEVEMLTLSPNFWGDQQSGNKHWFFILKGCLNPDPVRGIYNEFLRPELREHRKVFEVLGTKTMCPPSSQQLSGVGFSSTVNNKVTVRVHKTDTIRTYDVVFNT